MCWGTSETCGISPAGRTSSPRDFVIIKNDKRMSSVCNQNRLESVSLKEEEGKVTKRPCNTDCETSKAQVITNYAG